MSKKSIIYVFFFLISILHNPQFMYAQTIQIDNDLTTKYISKKIFSSKTRANVPEASSIQFGTDVSSRKVSSRLALNMTNGKNSVLLDDSYLKYKFKLSEIGFGKIAQPLRAALTGSNVSPGIAEVIEWLGKEESLIHDFEDLLLDS